MRNSSYDVLILGTGSTAAAAARAARDLNKSVLVTEERLVGGTCLNYGCMPSKFLIEAAKAYFTMQRPRYHGICCNQPSLSFPELIQQKDEIVREYRIRKRDTIFDTGVELEKGHARFVDDHTIDVDGKRFEAEKILIATGSRPYIPAIDGLSESGYLTSDLLTCDESMELRELPESLIILGGGYIALELGQMFARFGTRVTLLERSSQLLCNGYEPETGPVVREVLQDDGVEIHTDTEVTSIRRSGGRHSVSAMVSGKEVEFHASQLLVATGRQPNADRISLERAGVKVGSAGHVEVDEFMRTNVAHIFAAGDVIGKELGNQMATPVGAQDARLAINNAFSEVGAHRAEHDVIPRAIFTDPEIAMVGLTEESAAKEGYDCDTRTIRLSKVPRAVLMQHLDGFLKIVTEKESHSIIGATVVCPSAGEIIHQLALAIKLNASLMDLADLLYVYPSLSESVRIVSRHSPDRKAS